jgi:hypothetical protein
MSPIQAHEHHSGVHETSSEVCSVQGGHRASEPRVGYFGLVAQAPKLNNLETH